MFEVTEQSIANLKNEYIVRKTLFEQTQKQNQQSIEEIRQIISSITSEELQSVQNLGIDISPVLHCDTERLLSDREYYNNFQTITGQIIESLFTELHSKLEGAR